MQRITIIALMLLLSACESVAPRAAQDDESVTQGEEALTTAIAQNERLRAETPAAAPSQSLLDALLPPVAPPPESGSARFDLNVNGIAASDFFRSLVSGTPYNMVVHPSVQGSVSLDLKDVSLTEVMDVMRDVYGYDYLRQGNLFQVYPDAMRTEVFQIDYLNVTRRGKSEVQVSAGKVSNARRGNNINIGYGGAGEIAQQSGSGSGGDVVGTKVNTDSESNFWETLESTLISIIGDTPGASVMVTPQVGLAVVRAMPASLHAVRSYLDRAQLSLNRQVILEAKIIEVTLKSGFEAGVQWNTFGSDSGGSFKPVYDSDGNLIAAGSDNDVAGAFDAGDGVKNFFNPLGSAFTLNASFTDFEAIIDLLETQGTVQVLSSPRISTVNNQKAVIKVGSDEFFVTDISTTTITAGSAINTDDSPELTPFFSGIALDVTPQISEAGVVTLHVHPTVSDVQEQLKSIGGEDVPLAASTIRESDSIVRARSGQIVVIGGLMETISADADAGVPWFSKLPVLGYAFKQKQQSSTKRELVILLRPVVADDQAHIDAMNESLERMRALHKRISP